ncbi:MAG: hypothetical protein Q8P67_14225, partial [archaeon]|nr:hypothetical protein [archaeon]
QYMCRRDDQKEELQRRFEEQLRQRNQEDREANDLIRERNEQLRREIEALSQTGLSEQEDKKKANEGDIVALKKYIQELQAAEKKKEEYLEQRRNTLEVLTDKQTKQEESRLRLQTRLQEQESKSIDVDKLRHESRCNEDELTSLRENRKLKDSAKFEAETADSRALQAAEEALQVFNAIASEVQQAAMLEMEIPTLELNYHANPPESLLKNDLKGEVRPLLQKMIDALEERSRVLRDKIVQMNLQVDRMGPALEDLAMESKKTQQQIRQIAELTLKEKEASLKETAQMEARISTIELEVQQLKDKISACLLQSDESLQSVEETYRRCRLDIEAEETEWKSQLSRIVETLASHKERVTGALLKLGAHLEENHESYIVGQ